jgi:hypothetical protein
MTTYRNDYALMYERAQAAKYWHCGHCARRRAAAMRAVGRSQLPLVLFIAILILLFP